MDTVDPINTLLTGASAAGLASACVNIYTMAVPRRAPWVAIILAFVFGIGWTAIFAMRDIPLADPWTRVVWANIIINGATAAIGAAGIAAAQASAESSREKAKAQDAAAAAGPLVHASGTLGSGPPRTWTPPDTHGEPDPMTPISNPGLPPVVPDPQTQSTGASTARTYPVHKEE